MDPKPLATQHLVRKYVKKKIQKKNYYNLNNKYELSKPLARTYIRRNYLKRKEDVPNAPQCFGNVHHA